MAPKPPTLVLYTGIGSTRRSGRYTREEFIELMRKTFTTTRYYYKLYDQDPSFDPEKLKKYTFSQWVRWSGAELLPAKPT